MIRITPVGQHAAGTANGTAIFGTFVTVGRTIAGAARVCRQERTKLRTAPPAPGHLAPLDTDAARRSRPADHRPAAPAPAQGRRARRCPRSPTPRGSAPSALSLIENGKREAKLSLLTTLAGALDSSAGRPADRRRAQPPGRAGDRAGKGPARQTAFKALDIPAVRPGPRLQTEALESLVGLHRAMARIQAERAATPEQARRANADLRDRMRRQGNYFGEIETVAADLLTATKYDGGPITRTVVDRLAAHLGFRLVHTTDLPESTRTVTDLAHRIVYLPQPDAGQHDSRSLALQALGHVVLGHSVPQDYSEFLEQRVEINYFAASLLIPEKGALALLQAGQGGQGHRHRGPAGRLRGVLRDGGAPVHQPGHPAPRPAGALHADLVVRGDLQGLRERRRAFPDRRDRGHRGPAGLPVLDGQGGVRPAATCRRPTSSTPTPSPGPIGAQRLSTGRRPGCSR